MRQPCNVAKTKHTLGGRVRVHVCSVKMGGNSCVFSKAHLGKRFLTPSFILRRPCDFTIGEQHGSGGRLWKPNEAKVRDAPGNEEN